MPLLKNVFFSEKNGAHALFILLFLVNLVLFLEFHTSQFHNSNFLWSVEFTRAIINNYDAEIEYIEKIKYDKESKYE